MQATETITSTTLEVRKDKWPETRVASDEFVPELAEDEVLLRVDRLALTANNISYAASGDTLGYWGFFPAAEGWGRIPAMGWADVIASAHPEVSVGERVWGFFPWSTHLKIRAGRVTPQGFRDVSAHRADYAPIYAQFDRASTNPIYEPAREDQHSLLRGLFMTSWLVEDYVHEHDEFGAGACLITSASSKTSIALAYAVKQRDQLTSVGLTSAGNVAFCEGLGCYDTVITYEDIEKLDASQPVVMVDMAGNAGVIERLHNHYGENMKYSGRVGATHYEKMGPVSGLPGATPEFFFAPGHIQTRSAEMGAKKLMMSLGMSFVGFCTFCDGWLKVERNHGLEAVGAVYQKVLAGNSDPATGQIISMWPE